MTDIELGKNLKKARNNAHLTQAQVAEKVESMLIFTQELNEGKLTVLLKQ